MWLIRGAKKFEKLLHKFVLKYTMRSIICCMKIRQYWKQKKKKMSGKEERKRKIFVIFRFFVKIGIRLICLEQNEIIMKKQQATEQNQERIQLDADNGEMEGACARAGWIFEWKISIIITIGQKEGQSCTIEDIHNHQIEWKRENMYVIRSTECACRLPMIFNELQQQRQRPRHQQLRKRAKWKRKMKNTYSRREFSICLCMAFLNVLETRRSAVPFIIRCVCAFFSLGRCCFVFRSSLSVH